MKHIIVGTNRSDSRTKQIANIIQSQYSDISESTTIIDLAELELSQLGDTHFSPETKPTKIHQAIDDVNNSEGLIIVVPEYNGSYPGALKYFIDQWSYPKSFEYRPVCFVGLGGTWGGLRAVEHLQGIFGYRNSFMFPERVFINNVWDKLIGDKIKDELTMSLLKSQARGFSKFTKALQSQNLSANSR